MATQQKRKNWPPHNLQHGGRYTKLYNVWRAMKQRCRLKTSISYKYYGGRGIRVCEEWQSFAAFQSWALSNGYSEGLTIDRIDGNKDYAPSNCRWADWKTQGNNTRRNRVIEFRGERKTMAQWADVFCISYRAMTHRVQRGWDMQKIADTPQRCVNGDC